MKRKIVQIDAEKCNGCGVCAKACHEGAIKMQDGIARLMREDFCDGLGDCLPACPTGAISIIVWEADAYNQQAVQAKGRKTGCSNLSQWPVQLKLVPSDASYLTGAKLLIAADCTAYAYAAFHESFMKGRITLVGCPKLDAADYTQKLTEILCCNAIENVLVVRMEVPCCGGLEYAVKTALQNSGKQIPWQVVTLSNDGSILD